MVFATRFVSVQMNGKKREAKDGGEKSLIFD
jgi:hypothetical protein